ncbi:MAG: transglycosylase SLT domain-containing protein [Candidatus Gracilibacteria bacterium]
MPAEKLSDLSQIYHKAVERTSSWIMKIDTFSRNTADSNEKTKTDTQIAALQNGSEKKIIASTTQKKAHQLAQSAQESISESTKEQYLQEAFKHIQEKNSFLLGAPKNFSEVRTSDLLSHLRNFPEDARYFLLSQSGQAVEDRGFSAEAIGQKMIVNFGSHENVNEHANELLGLGDLLPTRVSQVEVDGKIGNLRSTPRPGYYFDKGDKNHTQIYLPIYNGSVVKILKIGEPNKNLAQSLVLQGQKREDKVRELEYEVLMRSNSKDIALLAHKRGDDARYQSASRDYETDEKMARDMEKKYQKQVKGAEGIMSRFGEYINHASAQYHVPASVIAQIISNESGGNPVAHPPKGSAYGLGQITDQTWTHILTTSGNHNWQRSNPEHQILAMTWLLRYLCDLRDCRNWGDVVVYYHVGAWASEKHLTSYMRANPAVARLMPSQTWDGYLIATRKYFGVDLPVS